MRAVYCTGAEQIAVLEVASPELRPGDALIRVVACGICGSDLHWYSGGAAPPSVCPGHEIVGDVIAVADASGARVAEGDRVAIEPLRPCGLCDRCRVGRYHLCGQLRILGVHENGGLADVVAAPLRSLYPIPSKVAAAAAVLAEPLAVAVHAARIGDIGVGDRVLVLGSGAIGLLAIVAARHRGAADIWATARYPQQAAAAVALGATRVFATDRAARRELGELSREAAIQVVVETVGGSAATLQQAVHLVEPGGTVVVLGLFHEAPAFPALETMLKEVRIIGSMVYSRDGQRSDFDQALDILAAQGDTLQSLVTHRFALDDSPSAFATAADKTTGSIKVVIEP